MTTRSAPRTSLAITLLCAAALAAACGGGSSGSTGASGGGAAAPASSAAAVVATHQGAMGTYLTDASGRTLYLFAADKGTTSTCTGTCAQFWPPLTTTGTPTAKGGAQSAKLGTTHRSDGTTQVTYAGHPLYRFAEDSAPGDARGQGKNLNGGLWWLVAPSGASITTTASAGASSDAGDSGY